MYSKQTEIKYSYFTLNCIIYLNDFDELITDYEFDLMDIRTLIRGLNC